MKSSFFRLQMAHALVVVLVMPIIAGIARTPAFVAVQPPAVGKACLVSVDRSCSLVGMAMGSRDRVMEEDYRDSSTDDGDDTNEDTASAPRFGVDDGDEDEEDGQHEMGSNDEGRTAMEEVPSFVTTTVLRQVYPAMIKHRAQYGNPNIPLGTVEGKKCSTIRRLHLGGGLTKEEVQLLESIQFRFSSLEEVYEEADFDDMLLRLGSYESQHGDTQVPKKYAPDPELGAWVTMVRRRGAESMSASQLEALEKANFAWVSNRKCGSAFMKTFRQLVERLKEREEGGSSVALQKEDVKWLRAQHQAYLKGSLTPSRVQYLDSMAEEKWGVDWRGF